MNGISSHGMVFIHSAGRALLPHLEWTMGRVLGGPIQIQWTPVDQALFRTEFHWQGDQFTGADLAAELMGWKSLRFEITNERNRWSYTPKLGIFSSETDDAGNILVNEFRMKAAMEIAGSNSIELQRQLRVLIGEPWDDELEEYRMRSAQNPIRWLRAN